VCVCASVFEAEARIYGIFLLLYSSFFLVKSSRTIDFSYKIFCSILMGVAFAKCSSSCR